MEQSRIAITHASESLVEAILEKLTKFGLESDCLVLLDEESRVGARLAFGDSYLTIEDQHQFDYSTCALVLLIQQDEIITQKLETQSALVLSHQPMKDGRSIYAANKDAELDISYTQQQMQLAGTELACLLGLLPALQNWSSIAKINTVFLRSAELHGKRGIDELAEQTVALLNGKSVIPSVYPLQIAFNILPAAAITGLNDDLPRLLGDKNIECTHQVVDVPVFHGLCATLQLTFHQPVDIKRCKQVLSNLENVILKEANASMITDCNQSFNSVLTGFQQEQKQPNTLQFSMIVDPLRYGLAPNYANVVDILLKSFL